MNPERWQKLMAAWDAPGSTDVYSALVAAYSESHRHYHTGQHIDDCLARLDEASSIVTELKEVELALWFHDAIYKPTSTTNELRSAEWARAFLHSVGAGDDRCVRVYDYIMATKHEAGSLTGDACVVVDIDLSILGREPDEYNGYEQAIRQEYEWVPWPLYRRKRAELLESFLHRPSIYRTERFRSSYESQAKRNIQSVIDELRK